MSTRYSDWPKKGDTREQPWVDPEKAGFTPRPGLPLLSSGSQHPIVHEIFSALEQLGYQTPVSRGENPFGQVGPEEMAAVRAFRNDYGVQEDPNNFGGDHPAGRELADNHIGPWTGEAILRAAASASAGESDGDGGELAGRVDALETKLADRDKRLRSLEGKVERLQNRKPAKAKAAAGS